MQCTIAKKILLDDKLLGAARMDAKDTLNCSSGDLEGTLAKYSGGRSDDSSRVLNSFYTCFSLYHGLVSRLEGYFPVNPKKCFSVMYALYIGASEARSELEEESESNMEFMSSETPNPFEQLRISTDVYPHKQANDLVREFEKACSNSFLKSRKGILHLGRDFFDDLRACAWNAISGDEYKQSFEVAKAIELHYRGKVVRGFDTSVSSGKVNGKQNWGSIAGYDSQKEYFQKIQFRIQNWERAVGICSDSFVHLPNVFMYGPPGTGKTKMAKVFASECGVPYFEIDLGSFASSYHNATMKNLIKKLDEAAAVIRKGISRVAVMYIDEFTSVGGARFGKSSKEDDKVTDTLLRRIGEETQVPGLMVLAGANTVSEDIISPTLLSRFELLEFPAPDEKTQSHIISLYQNHFTAGTPARVFENIDAGKMARSCVYADGTRMVPRHIRQVMARMVRDVVDNELRGRQHKITEERFLQHLREYVASRDVSGKKDYA